MSDFDVTEIIEQETRRQRALNTGSRHYTDGPRWQGRRDDAASELDVPELLYPSGWHLRPQRCWNCGSGRASFETHPPYGFVKQGESSCFVCSRVVVRWRSDGSREIVGKPAAEPLPVEPEPVRRRPRIRDASERPCLDCTERPTKPDRRRCRPCARKRAEEARAGGVFRRLMRPGVPMQADVLQRLMGLSRSGLHSAVLRARGHGVRITSPQNGWLVLEAAP